MKISNNAAKILTVWTDASMENSKQTNAYHAKGKDYIWQTSDTVYADGAVSGTIFCCGQDGKKPVSSFRIDGDGTVVRAPTFLRNASKSLESELALEGMVLKSRRE